MKRTEPQSLREVLEEAVRESDMEGELLRRRAIALWPYIVGDDLATRTGRPFFRGGTMFVAVHNPSMRQELSMMRSTMADAINRALRLNVVEEIRFIGINSNQPT